MRFVSLALLLSFVSVSAQAMVGLAIEVKMKNITSTHYVFEGEGKVVKVNRSKLLNNLQKEYELPDLWKKSKKVLIPLNAIESVDTSKDRKN